MTDQADTGYDSVFAQPGQDPEHTARQEAGRSIDTAVLRMARTARAGICQRRPFGPDSALTAEYAEPFAGIRYALMLWDAAQRKVREYIKYARQEGLTWVQVGEALNLRRLAEERGAWIADLAFGYAAGAGHARPFETLTFAWRCPACGGLVMDCGPSGGHPEDCEPGHQASCSRLVALVAAHDARWADE